MKLLLSFFLVVSIGAHSQIDTLFWFAAPEATSIHGDRPIRLVTTSFDKESRVIIDMPSNSSFSPIEFTLPANGSSIIDLTDNIDLIENRVINTAINSGLRIRSTSFISCYYEVLGTGEFGVVNTDIFTLKGKNALGLSFYLPFQNKYNNEQATLRNEAWATCNILATEDNTSIEVFATNDFTGQSSNFIIILNRGQVYSLNSESVLGRNKPIATKIVATKKIAITLTDDSILHPSGGWDLIGDQLIPIEKWGYEYVVRPGDIYIITDTDDTEISVDGVLTTTLQEGEFYELEFSSGAHYISSSEPILVFQLITLGGELGAAVLPQINCTGSNSIRFSRSTSEPLFLDIITKKGSENDFVLNGQEGVIIGDSFQEVPGTNGKWMFATLGFISEGTIKAGDLTIVENSKSPFHLAIINGQPGETGARYGFFSDFGLFDLGQDQEICGNEPVLLDAGLGRDFYNWSTGASSQTIEVTQSGIYKLTAEEGVNCRIEDSVKISFYDLPSVSLNNVSKFCEGTSTQIVATPDYVNYEWNGSNNKGSILTITEGGTYFVTVTDTNDCKKTSTETTIFRTPLPKVQLGDSIQILCAGESKTFFIDPIFDVQWSDGSMSNERKISEEGFYKVKVFNECGATQDEVAINTWKIDYPNILTPNGDGKNDVFVVSGISFGTWNLIITNRYGKTVFETKDYKNNYIPQDLSDGVYYFHLSQGDECNSFAGWIQVVR